MKTDIQLQQDVIAELAWDPSIEASEIGVEVKNGVVTLAGHVGSYREKVEAERAAQRVSGVKALAVEMDVELLASNVRHDSDIARSAKNTLDWLPYLPKDGIKVVAEGGVLKLTGEVEWDYQKQSAGGAVRHLMGVTGVTNEISVKPTLSRSAVQSDIEAALQRHAKADAQNISVRVDGANVTLSGNVGSWSEKEMARTSASSAPGVRTVVDNLVVSY